MPNKLFNLTDEYDVNRFVKFVILDNDGYYEQTERFFVVALILFVFLHRDKNRQTLEHVCEMSKAHLETLCIPFQRIARENPDDISKKYLDAFLMACHYPSLATAEACEAGKKLRMKLQQKNAGFRLEWIDDKPIVIVDGKF